jgi:hypothetical protein
MAAELTNFRLAPALQQGLLPLVLASERQIDLFYWRTRSGVEVDFIVYGKAGFWAIEVKNTDRVRTQDLRSLQAFMMDYPQCQPIFLYRGKNQLRINNIWCLPAEEFLRKLHPSQDIAEGLVALNEINRADRTGPTWPARYLHPKALHNSQFKMRPRHSLALRMTSWLLLF